MVPVLDLIGLLTIGEAAEIVGARPGTVRSWITRHSLPTVQFGGAVLVAERAVLDCDKARRDTPAGRPRVAG